MARNQVAGCLTALTALAVSGCGTIYNYGCTGNSERFYGGVTSDVQFAALPINNPWVKKAPLELPVALVWAVFPLADLPLSFIADTLVLPYPLYLYAADHPERFDPRPLPPNWRPPPVDQPSKPAACPQGEPAPNQNAPATKMPAP